MANPISLNEKGLYPESQKKKKKKKKKKKHINVASTTSAWTADRFQYTE